jgi:hypothetical protein
MHPINRLPSTRKHAAWALALGVTLALSAAACGNADSDDGDVSPTLRAETAAPSAAVLVPPEKSPWAPDQCDAVYEFRAHGPGGPGTPYTIPVGSEIHPQIMFGTPWGDEPVQVVAWRPLTDNKKVIHHWILWQGQANLMGWAPGGTGVVNPGELGTELPSGRETLRLDMHYYNLGGGKDELDQSGVVMCVVKGKNLRTKIAAVHGGFNIFSPVMVPPAAQGYELKGTCTVKANQPATLVSIAPHAHTRARHMTFTVVKPDGRQIVLHDRDFAFQEQVGYPFDPPFILENGDVVNVMCRYDNETSKVISWGEGTQDEMCIHWVNYWPKGAFTCGPISFFGARPTLPTP